MSAEEQPPIADFALIGDCHGSALVSRSASIDWCCLRRFDADPIFFRMLDAGRGGFWDVTPDGVVQTSRAYLPGTNIMRTLFVCQSSTLAVTDFMPVGRSRDASVHDYVSLNAPCWLVRRFECTEGQVRFLSRFRPRGPGFALDGLALRHDGATLRAQGVSLWCGGAVEVVADGADIVFGLTAGQIETAVLSQTEPLGDAPGVWLNSVRQCCIAQVTQAGIGTNLLMQNILKDATDDTNDQHTAGRHAADRSRHAWPRRGGRPRRVAGLGGVRPAGGADVDRWTA